MSLSIPPKPVAVVSNPADVDFPDHFLCPITCDVMHDPVRDPNGHVYERQALLRALAHNPTSPLTRAPLQASQLHPADSVREAIAAFPGARIAAAQAAAERQKQWATEPTVRRAPEPTLTPAELRDLDWLGPARPRLAARPAPLAVWRPGAATRRAPPMLLAPPLAWRPIARQAAAPVPPAPAWRRSTRPAAWLLAPPPAWPYQFIDPPTPRWRRASAQHRAAPRPTVAGAAAALVWRGSWHGARVQWGGVF